MPWRNLRTIVLLLHSHDHYTYTYTCRNIFNTIKTSGHSSLEKIYLSLYLKGLRKVFSVRGELETEQNCNILTPTLLAITAFLSHPPGCSTWSLGAQPFWDMVIIPASSLQLIWTSCRRGYIIIWRPLFLLWASQFRTQFNPSTVKVAPDLLISSTGCTSYLHRCSSFDSLAGVNM